MPISIIALQNGVEIRLPPHAQLEPHGLSACKLPQPGDELDQTPWAGKGLVPRRREHRLARWYAPDLCDLGCHLDRREDPAVPGLGPLGQFEFDHADGLSRGLVLEHLRVELAVRGAAAEVAGTDLPYDVTALLVMGAVPALTGILVEAGELGAFVDGHDGLGAQ